MSVDELLLKVDELDTAELDRLADRVHWLRARKKAPVLEPQETELLMQINRALPPESHHRYQTLAQKRDGETLTEEEHQELIQLSDRMELLGAQRIQALAQLADLRQISLLQVMEDLGVQGAGFA